TGEHQALEQVACLRTELAEHEQARARRWGSEGPVQRRRRSADHAASSSSSAVCAQAEHTPCWHRHSAQKIHVRLPTSPIPQNAHSPSNKALTVPGSFCSSAVCIVCPPLFRRGAQKTTMPEAQAG